MATIAAGANCNQLGADLLNALYKPSSSNEPAGAFISSVSISLALSLLLNGAADGSPSFREVLQLLSRKEAVNGVTAANELLQGLSEALKADEGEGLTLSIANSVWVKPPLSFASSYLKAVQTTLKATAHQLKSAKEVNTWCSTETRGKIEEIVDEGTVESMNAMLINAVYFKGDWELKFDKADTGPLTFTTPSGANTVAAMMYKKFENGKAGYFESPTGFSAARLPYKGGKFAAVALLPAEGKSASSVFEHMHTLKDARWNRQELHVWLPRFKLESSFFLKQPLQQLGAKTIFVGSPDFKQMFASAPSVPFLVDEIVHKVFIEVNEEGTEAAAVTAVMMRMAAVIRPREIKFDRPFVFAVQHVSSGAFVFAGVVDTPEVWQEKDAGPTEGPPPGYPTGH